MRAIVDTDRSAALDALSSAPALATAVMQTGATRGGSDRYYLASIGHYVYDGETALHLAAAAYRADVVRALVAQGADVNARNRRGAAPLHFASVGQPGSASWNPEAQVETITSLVRAGALVDAADKGGVTPLHRAVRTRCAAAVCALLALGADPRRRNGGGSTPLKLARLTTGRGGSGTDEARAQQTEILRVLAGPG